LLHRLVAEYYFSESCRITGAPPSETWKHQAVREKRKEDLLTIFQYMFYHALRGGISWWVRGSLNQLDSHLTRSGNYETLRQYYEEFLLRNYVFNRMDAHDRARVYAGDGWYLSHLGYVEEVRSYMRKAEECLRQECCGYPTLHADVLLTLGGLARKLDDPRWEIELYEWAREAEPDKNRRKFFEDLESRLAGARKRLDACSTPPVN